jgi:transposase
MSEPNKGGLNGDQRAVDDNDYRLVAELHAQGLGRNEIARRINRGSRTVSVIAARLNLTFDRTMTEEATRARKADLEERRAILAEALQSDAEQLTEQLWQPHRVFRIGGAANKYVERQLDEPPADAKKDLMSAAGIAIEKSLKLVPPDREDLEGLAAVDAWLRGMMPGE